MNQILAQILAWWDISYIRALLICLVTVVFTLLVRFLIGSVATRMAGKTKTELDDQLIRTFRDPLSISILAFGFWQAVITFNPPETPRHTLSAVLTTAIILMWTVATVHFSAFFIEHLAARPERYRFIQPRTKPLFKIVLKTVVLVLSLYCIIVAWDQDVTGWFASAGVAGIAIGFAAKDTLANFISGIFIIADAPYKIGDYIVLDNEERGRVTDIGIRSTRLLTRDDVEVIIPNAIIGNSRITNQSGGPYEKFRLRVPVSVAYGSDIDLVREILMETALAEEQVQRNPEPHVRFRAFGDSGLEFELRVWVSEPEILGIVLDIMLVRIYKAFCRQ